MPIAHNTEHDSRHVCTDISHIAMHKDRQGPGGTLVVGVPAVVLGVVLGIGPIVVLYGTCVVTVVGMPAVVLPACGVLMPEA